MLRKISLSLFIIIFLQFSLPHPTIAQDEEIKTLPLLQSDKSSNKPDYVEGEVIVKYKSEKKKVAALQKIASDSGDSSVAVKDQIDDSPIAVLKSDKKSTAELMDEMKKDSTVEFVEPNYRRELTYAPNDTYFSSQWEHKNNGQIVTIGGFTYGSAGTAGADISTARMWDIESSSAPNTTIAVIDGGIYYNNTELHSNMWDGSYGCKSDTGTSINCPNHGWDFADNDNNPLPNTAETDIDPDHGTFVSSILAGITNNGRIIAGMSRYNHDKIMAVRFGLDVATEIKAIHFAKNNGAKVINASFVGNNDDPLEKAAIESFPGIFVAAAGNASVNVDTAPRQYPCSYDLSNIICVGASDQNDNISSFSNYSATSVDIVAPGENLVGLYRDSYTVGGGTSYATPQVAGLAGVLYSERPCASIPDVRNTILQSSDQLPSLSEKIASGRRLNANRALQAMQNKNVTDGICPSPVYRLYNTKTGTHVYARGESERNQVIQTWPEFEFTDSVPAFYASLITQSGLTPIYRLYNTKTGAQVYARGESERDITMQTWPEFEFTDGVPAFYASLTGQSGLTAIYRLYNTKTGMHVYARGQDDRDLTMKKWPEFEFTDGAPAFYEKVNL